MFLRSVLPMILIVGFVSHANAQCTGASGNISVTMVEANNVTFHYEWAVSNSANGQGNRLETAYFEIGGYASSNTAVGSPSWSSTTSPTPGWNAVQFDYGSGTIIAGGATQTFSYDLDSYMNDVNIQTASRNGTIENFFIEDLDMGCTLPVELAAFTATKSNGVMHLEWETSSETNTSGFELEVRNTGQFESTAFIGSVGTATSGARYSHEYTNDVSLGADFRLKILDHDGSSTYSSVLEIDPYFESNSLVAGSLYPNPARSGARMEVATSQESNIHIEIYDLLGRSKGLVVDRRVAAGERSEISIDTTSLSDGMYIVRISNNKTTISRKLVVNN